MNILNLAYPERGNVRFKKLSFPDGQQDIVVEEGYPSQRILGEEVHIISRMNSFQDLELIACAREALSGLGVFDEFYLKVPYFLGARSDRRFVEGGTAYLRNVIAPLINELDFDRVEILDPHSDVVEAVIDGYWAMELEIPFHEWVYEQLLERHNDTPGFIRLVSPDAGSLKKIYKIAGCLGYEGEVIVAQKHREVSTGKILSTTVPLDVNEHKDSIFVIFDDICDGGRTFIEIAKVIKATFPSAPVYLAITHGIFSAGFTELAEYFTHIFTTNSVREIARYGIPGQLITQLDVL